MLLQFVEHTINRMIVLYACTPWRNRQGDPSITTALVVSFKSVGRHINWMIVLQAAPRGRSRVISIITTVLVASLQFVDTSLTTWSSCRQPKRKRQGDLPITTVLVALFQFVGRHIINRMIVKCEIPKSSTYGIKSRQGDFTVFNYDTRGNLLVNDLINVVQVTIIIIIISIVVVF